MRFRYQILRNEDDFEDLCCRLLRRRWNRPLLQRYAHRGESQDGVDIHDPSQTKPIYGAQCKLHDSGKTISPREIEREVEKAKRHQPRLDHYAILTTARKSKQADKKVAAINAAHQEQGLFVVEVLTWDQIENLLDDYPDIRDPVYMQLSATRLSRLDQKLSLICARVETPSEPSSDFIDAELDSIKVELDKHELRAVRRLTERLQERYIGRLSPCQRWRAITYLANSYIGEGAFERGGALLLQAASCQQEDEKARTNEAMGHELLGHTDEAHRLAERLRSAYPHSAQIAALWIRTAPQDVDAATLEASIAEVPDLGAEIPIALSMCSLIRQDLERSEKHGVRATQLDPDSPQPWVVLGQARHMRGFKTVDLQQRTQLLRQAQSDYDRAIECAHRHGNVFLEAASHLNRAVVLSLLNDSAAEADYRSSLRLRPNDPDCLRKYALFLATQSRFDDSVTMLRDALKLEPSDESASLLAAALSERQQGTDLQEALELNLRLARESKAERRDIALHGAVVLLLQLGRASEVEGLLNSLPEDYPCAVARLVYLARTRQAQNNLESAANLAKAAYDAVNTTTSTATIRRLANLLAAVQLYGLALELLERTAVLGLLGDDARLLLHCARQLRRHDVILKTCEALRQAGNTDRPLLDAEIDLLQMYDRPKAISVLQGFLSSHLDDRAARLRLSLLGIMTEQENLVEASLAHLPPVEGADPETIGTAVVFVLRHANKNWDALEYAYSLLRRSLDDPHAHLLYVYQFLHGGDWQGQFDVLHGVQDGMAVCYKEVGDTQLRWWIIESDEPDSIRDEYHPENSRVKSLLGTHIGHEFDLSPGALQPRRAVIADILSKYVHRLRESMNRYQSLFPDRSDLQRVLLRPNGAPDGDFDFTPLTTFAERRRAVTSQVWELYRATPAPFHMLTRYIGPTVLDVLDEVATHTSAPIRCAEGTPESYAAARSAIRDAKTIVLTLSALYAIWKLDLTEPLRKLQGRRFVVSAATFDAIRTYEAAEAERLERALVDADITADNREKIARHLNGLKSVLAFVRESCIVSCVGDVASLASDVREELIGAIGRDAVESAVLASRPKHAIWTDDGASMMGWREHFKAIPWVWTQVALDFVHDEGAITKTTLDSCIARLLGWEYVPTVWNVDVLFHAGALSEWQVTSWPLVVALRQFANNTVPMANRVGMAAQLIVRLFATVQSPDARASVIRGILRQFASRGPARALAALLDQAFGLDGMSAAEARGVIGNWLAGLLWVPEWAYPHSPA